MKKTANSVGAPVGAQHAVPLRFVPVRSIPPRMMPVRKRKSVRLRGYDYSQAGAYFVTICAHDRMCLFGKIVGGQMRLNDAGSMVQTCWDEIPAHFSQIETDAFVIMPNHVHGIIVIHDGVGPANDTGTATPNICTGTACCAPTSAPTHRDPVIDKFKRPVAGSIPVIVRSFKSAATRRINEIHSSPGAKLWQRNYWERVIRIDTELNCIREYIHNNPAQWGLDKLFVDS